MTGDPVSAVANATGKTVDAVSQVAVSKIQADASVKMAKVAAQASRYQTSVNEADEILSVLDRPCVRVNIPDPDFSVTMDLSILSFLGILAGIDLYKGYRALWDDGIENRNGATSNTDVISGLSGSVPMDPRALAVLAGVFQTTTTPNNGSGSSGGYPDNPLGSGFFDLMWNELQKFKKWSGSGIQV